MKRSVIKAAALALMMPAVSFAGTGSQEFPTQQSSAQQAGQETQQEGVGETRVDQEASAEERSLLARIHQINVSEINASLLAYSRATSPEVREYAWDLFQEHSMNEKKVYELSERYDINLQEELLSFTGATTDSEAFMTSLKEASDEAFDLTYVQGMVDSHQNALADLEIDQDSFQVDEISAFITATADSIDHHREEANKLLATIQVAQPVAAQPTAGQPTAAQPTAGQPTAGQPTGGRPVR